MIAQKPNYKFKSIKSADGLINSTVQAIFEDSYGFIWLGTHHGLQRYDGKSFTNFTRVDNDSTGLSHNFINDFCEDANGDIWIATGIGLNRYSRKQDKIFHYHWNGEYAKDFNDIGVLKVLHDNQEPNIIWISSGDSKLIKLNSKNENVDVFEVPGGNTPNVLMQMKHPHFQNHLLIGTTELFIFDKKTTQFRNLISLEQSHSVPNNMFNSVTFDPTDPNILWCATGDIWGRGELGGLIRHDLETGESKLFSWENRPGEIPDRHILTVCFSDDIKLWVGTRNYGPFGIEKEKITFQKGKCKKN